ncbi:MAG: MASE1 domain-containing protein [Anaerolineae bacterium]|nr:MASE1 domain-containing protein [Anaerolineae bacterium]
MIETRNTNTAAKARSLALYLLQILALAVVYHLAARVGLKMAYVQVNTSPVWPPTGIALAALLIFGYRLWPGISLGVLLGSVLTGAPLGVAVGMTIGNTLEALAGAFGLQRVVAFHKEMDRIRDVVGLALVSVVSTAVSATFGTATLALTGGIAAGHGTIWLTWWIGDLLSALVVTPMLLVWVTPPPLQTNRRAYAEGGALLLMLGLVTWYVFSNQPPVGTFHQALLYVIFPFMIWAALRFGQRGAATAAFLVSGIAIWSTSQGMGPFSRESLNDSLVLLQTFTGVLALTSLILAAATIERRKATDALRQRVNDLVTLNDSSKTFLDNSSLAGIYDTICRLAVTRLGADAAWIESPAGEGSEPRLTAACGINTEAVADLKARWEKAFLPPDQGEGHTAVHLYDADGRGGRRPPWAHTVRPYDADGRGGRRPPLRTATADDLAPSQVDYLYQSYAAFPLVFSNESLGLLKLVSRNKAFFTEDRCLLIQSYANLAAVAIQNAWLFDEVRRGNKQLHALSQRLMKAQEEERLHLSRELHDESGQLLAALMVQLGLLERDADQPGIVRERIGALKQATREIQDKLHRLAINLRPASLDHLGLVTALEQYVKEFRRQYNIDVEFEAVGMQDRRLPGEVETALFRIVQESLTNVVLHAQATRVDVLISLRDRHVVAIIEDNGVGFVPTSPTMESHLGIFGMRERVEMLGGKLAIESAPGRGTTVSVEVPLDD